MNPIRPALRYLAALFFAVTALAEAKLSLDPTFHADLPPDFGTVSIADVAPDGSVLINLWSGSHNRVARLHADGSLDAGFTPPASVGDALACFPDGGVLLTLPPYRLAADGAAAPVTLPAGFDPARPLTDALVLPDGKFLLAQNRQLARFSADGSLDPSFTFANPHDAYIQQLKLDAKNRVVLEELIYQTSSDTTRLACRLSPDGSQDPTFTPFVGGYRVSVQIFPLADGGYLAFSTFEGGVNSTFTRLDSSGVAKWSSPFEGPYTGTFTVDPHGHWLYTTGARYPITDEGLGAYSPLPVPAARYVVTPDGRVLSTRVSPRGLARMLTGDVYLSNLSGRARTGDDENTVIAGLVVGEFDRPAAADTPVLFRGAGPALTRLGVSTPLANPAIDLFDYDGHRLGGATRWDASLGSTFDTVGAFSFTAGSDDSAFVLPLPAVHATLLLRNENASAHGVGLLEVYRVPSAAPSRQLLNLSFRARTGPGDDTAIAGFVIVDPENRDRSARVLLRAVGPTLGTKGIAHPLENPILTLYDSAGKRVDQNDDWSVARATAPDAPAAIAAAAKQVGAFDLTTDSRDAALLLDLPAGAYSMHATGGEGVVLLEIYLVR